MPDKPFVHLHCHSDYSLLDGACEIGKMMNEVQAQAMPAIALTDHGNLFGAMEFYTKANAKGRASKGEKSLLAFSQTRERGLG